MSIMFDEFEIEYLGCDDCEPGKPGYGEAMETFAADFRSHMTGIVDEALGKNKNEI